MAWSYLAFHATGARRVSQFNGRRDAARRIGKPAQAHDHCGVCIAPREEPLRRVGDVAFVGYETTSSDGRIVAIVREGIEYQELTGNAEVEIVLDSTPFYAEGGGQVGDTGELREEGGGSVLVTVEDTTRPVGAQGAGHE